MPEQNTGKNMMIWVEGVGKVKCTVLSERRSSFIVKGDDGIPITIPKNKICMFGPTKEQHDEDFKPVYICACQNKEINCNGVRYFVSGEEPGNDNFRKFTKDCPCVRNSCVITNLGEISHIKRSFVAGVLDDLIVGEYPEPKEKEQNHTNEGVDENE